MIVTGVPVVMEVVEREKVVVGGGVGGVLLTTLAPILLLTTPLYKSMRVPVPPVTRELA